MSVFICEKCGYLDNSACNNNYYHARRNKFRVKHNLPLDVQYKPEFEYFETHVCCSTCCENIIYQDSSRMRDNFSYQVERKHWTEFGKETLLELESLNDGSMVNATEYFNHIDEQS